MIESNVAEEQAEAIERLLPRQLAVELNRQELSSDRGYSTAQYTYNGGEDQ
jgi:hypothetical protein